MAGKLLLIDGHSILNRAYYGLPDLTNNEGIHTNAVLGFIKIMLKTIEEEKAEYITVAFDLHEPTFRHKVYAEYKGTRSPMPEELRQQVPLIKETLASMGIKIVTKGGFEADDILGTLSKTYENQGFSVVILSGDRDLLQLASDNIKIRMPKTKKGGTEVENYNAEEVIATYGVTPKEFIDLKALMGDSSDNIKGAPGIGEKTAKALIEKFHSIDEIYSRIEEVTPPKAKKSMLENVEDIKLSRFLVTINTEVPLDYDIETAKIENLFTKDAYDMFVRLGFKALLGKFSENNVSESVVDISKLVKYVSDFDEVEEVFNKAKKSNNVGVHCIVEEEELKGVSICFDSNVYCIQCMFFVTDYYISEKLKELCTTVCVSFCEMKEQLEFIPEYCKEKMFDCSIAAYLLNPLKEKYLPEDYASIYLHENLVPAAKDMNLVASNYAYVAYRTKEILVEQLKKEEMYSIYTDIEYPLLFILLDMQKEGIMVDKVALKKYGESLLGRIDELEQLIYKQAGCEFNINSPKQLGEILFEKLAIPNGKKTKTGYSTSAEVLEKLAIQYPIVSDILEYRQLTKLNSTYVEGLSVYIKEDNRIHGKFNQTITATGRISSTEPNLQNIPVRMELGRLIRKVFIPKEGCVFVDADYSQIELRIMAHMSEDDILIDAYNQAKDIHAITASQVFNVPLEEVTALQRRNAKAVNFGIIYGISSFGLSQDLNLSRKEANEYIENYFASYPKVKAYLDKTVENAKNDGYSKTLYGRKRPIPELKSSNFMTRQFGERVAMNSPIQGTAADIMKIAMIRTYNRLKQEGLKSKIILQIHDELMIEAYEEEKDIVMNILKEEMIAAANLKVKLEVDAHMGKDWFDVK